MFSYDLSTTNILLTVAVVGLFTFFIVLLMKLNPSTEKKERLETRIEVERPKPLQTAPIMAPQKTQPVRVEAPMIEAQRVAEKPVVAVSPGVGGGFVQTRQIAPAQAPVPTLKENREVPCPQEKAVAPAKTEAFPSRRDCLHHFGYLRTFPKNSPIPDECFGCEKIVDCLVNNKKSNGRNERWR